MYFLMVIFELICLLIKKYYLKFDEVVEIVCNMVGYINYIIFVEVLEKWLLVYLNEVVLYFVVIIKKLD